MRIPRYLSYSRLPEGPHGFEVGIDGKLSAGPYALDVVGELGDIWGSCGLWVFDFRGGRNGFGVLLYHGDCGDGVLGRSAPLGFRFADVAC